MNTKTGPWTSAFGGALRICADLTAMESAPSNKPDSLLDRRFSELTEGVNNVIGQDFIARVLDANNIPLPKTQEDIFLVSAAALGLFSNAAGTIRMVTRGHPLQIIPGFKRYAATAYDDSVDPKELVRLLDHDTARKVRVALLNNIESLLPDDVKDACHPHLLSVMLLGTDTPKRYPDIKCFHPAFSRDTDRNLYNNIYSNMLAAIGTVGLASIGDALSPLTQETMLAAKDHSLAIGALRVYANTPTPLWDSAESLIAFSQMSALLTAMFRHDRPPQPVSTAADFAKMASNLTSRGIVDALHDKLPLYVALYRDLMPDLSAAHVASIMVDPYSKGMDDAMTENFARLTATLKPHFEATPHVAHRLQKPRR